MISFEFLGPPELLIRMLRAFSATDLHNNKKIPRRKKIRFISCWEFLSRGLWVSKKANWLRDRRRLHGIFIPSPRSKYFLYSQVIALGFIVIMNEASVAGIEPATSQSCLMSTPLRPNLGDQIAYYWSFFRYLDLRNTNAKSSQPTTNVLTEFCPDLCTTYHF